MFLVIYLALLEIEAVVRTGVLEIEAATCKGNRRRPPPGKLKGTHHRDNALLSRARNARLIAVSQDHGGPEEQHRVGGLGATTLGHPRRTPSHARDTISDHPKPQRCCRRRATATVAWLDLNRLT